MHLRSHVSASQAERVRLYLSSHEEVQRVYQALHGQVLQVGPDKHLQMMFVQRGAMDTRAPVGTPGKVALADGTVLELVSGKESIPVANANENGVFTQWIVEFPLADINAAEAASASGSVIKPVLIF